MEEKPFESSLGLEQANKQSPEKIAKKKKLAIFGGVVAVSLLLLFVVFTQAEFFLGQATTEFEEEIAIEQAASGENATGNPTTEEDPEDPEQTPEEEPEEDPDQNTGDPDSIEEVNEECSLTIDETNFEGGVYTFKVLTLENLDPSELEWALQIVIDPRVTLNVNADRASSTLELPETFEGQFFVIVSHSDNFGEIECSEMWTVDVISEIEDPEEVPEGDPEEDPDPNDDTDETCTMNINPVSESEDNFLFEIESIEGFEDASDLQWIMTSEPDHENELEVNDDNLSATLLKQENYEGVIDVLVTKNDIEGVLLCSAAWTVEVTNEAPEDAEGDPETEPEDDPEEDEPETTPEEEEELICQSLSHTAPTVVDVDGVPHWEVCASSHPEFIDFIWSPEPVEEIGSCTYYEITAEGGEVNIGHESNSKCSESLTLPGCAEFNEELQIMIGNGNLALAEIFREEVEALGLSCFEDETPEDPEVPEDPEQTPEDDPEVETDPDEDQDPEQDPDEPETDPDPVDNPEEEVEQCTINQSPVNLENGVYEFKVESFEGFEDPNDLEWSMSFDPEHENEMTLSPNNMTASVDEPIDYSGELRVFVSKNNIEGLAICSADWSVEIENIVVQNDPPVRDQDPEDDPEDPEEDPVDPEDPPQIDQFTFQDDDDDDQEPENNPGRAESNNNSGDNDNELPPVLVIDDNNNNNNGNNFASSNNNSTDDDDDDTVSQNTIVRTVLNQETQEVITIPNGGRTVIELQDPDVREELDIASNYVITEVIDPSNGQVSILTKPVPLHSAAPIIQGDTGPEVLIYSLALAVSGMIFFGMKKVRVREN